MTSWLGRQTESNVSRWETAIEKYYPQYHRMWSDPAEHYRCLHELWNTYDAIKMIDWELYLPHSGLTVLDLGCGTGWLSAYLSRNDKIGKIYSVDSSSFFIEVMLPEIVRLMAGDRGKIEPIRGLFSPILLADASIDICVASSALHHADNLEELLNEIARVLTKDGVLFVLNETPDENEAFLERLEAEFRQLMIESRGKIFKDRAKSISSVNIIYDPILWDRAFPLWYWKEAIQRAGFLSPVLIRTGLLSLKTETVGPELTHFICRK